MRPHFAAAALACLLLVPLPARAAVYYVAGTQAGAADVNPGTEAKPLKTISAAIARVQPGDTVLVKSGTYREAVVYPGQDWKDPTKRITLAAAPGHKPIIKGSEVLPATWQRLPDGRPIFFQPRDVYTQMLFMDELPLKQIGLQGSPKRAAGKNGFQFQKQWDGKGLADMRPGSFFYDDQEKRLYAWLSDGGDPAKHVMEAAVRADGLSLHGTWTVRGLQVCQMADDFWPHEQAAGVSGDRSVVENCRFIHNDLLGLIVSGQDCIIRNNEIAYNGLMGFTSNVGYRMLFEGNELHHNGWRGDVKCLTQGNKMVMWRDCQFLRNWWHDEPACALWLDISDGNILIAENRFDNCHCGIYFEICRWAVIANNVLRNCGRGIWSYSSDVLIAHNVLDQCPEGIVVTGSARHCNYNQAITEPNKSCLMAVRNNLIVNNLLLDSVGAFIGITLDDGYGAGNWSDHNAFAWTLPTTHLTGMHINFMSGWDTLYGKLPIWRLERHQDEHSMLSDAVLVRELEQGNPWISVPRSQLVSTPGVRDRAKQDYRLAPDSPLRGKGVRLPGVLNSPCRPCDGKQVVSRQFAMTQTADAPAALQGRTVADVWGAQHYRLQPLPAFRQLADLDALPPDDPGLNERWLAGGQYPAFDATAAPEAAPDDAWSVYPDNRLQDPSFKLPLGKPGQGGPWVGTGTMHLYCGIACANLGPTDQQRSTIVQRIGSIVANGEYILWGEAMAHSSDPRFIGHCELRLAAGDGLAPVGEATDVLGQPNQTGHWRTAFARYKAGPAGQDANVGKDLYVVLAARVEGPTNVKLEGPAALARWDNLVLLTSEKP